MGRFCSNPAQLCIHICAAQPVSPSAPPTQPPMLTSLARSQVGQSVTAAGAPRVSLFWTHALCDWRMGPSCQQRHPPPVILARADRRTPHAQQLSVGEDHAGFSWESYQPVVFELP
jgi:hypothetical protein